MDGKDRHTPDLAKYSRVTGRETDRANSQKKLSSPDVVVFINGRTLRPSLAIGGVRRFSSPEQGSAVFRYGGGGREFGGGFVLQIDDKGTTKEEYLKQLGLLIEQDRTAYKRELIEQRKSAPFNTRAFLDWVNRRTRWGYTEGIEVLLQMAEYHNEGGSSRRAVWVLRDIRDPASGERLREMIERSLREEEDLPFFEHVRAVGYIGGDKAIPFLVALATSEDPVRHSEISDAAVHGLQWLSQQYRPGTEQFDIVEKAILGLDPEPSCVREALTTIATEGSIERLQAFAAQTKERFAAQKWETDEMLYQDTMERIAKARERLTRRQQEQKELEALLKKVDW